MIFSPCFSKLLIFQIWLFNLHLLRWQVVSRIEGFDGLISSVAWVRVRYCFSFSFSLAFPYFNPFFSFLHGVNLIEAMKILLPLLGQTTTSDFGRFSSTLKAMKLNAS
jgi:hypothetical protein